ncbi:MAG: hypothetical protein CL797_00050 [Chromatiales bacterium]|nr:hypothetical protein [Chromatiales bacterium]
MIYTSALFAVAGLIMEENQSREQYWFEDETFEWLGDLISRTQRVGAVFTPSLLKYPNVWVFDADERFQGSERYTMADVTRSVPNLEQFGMIILDPPFALSARDLAPLLKPARKRPLLISATDWCVAKAGWGQLFSTYGLSQVTSYFPRYRSIANGYCENGLKRDGRTNISFFSNIPFGPPRQSVVLHRENTWITHDPYNFFEQHRSDSPPADESNGENEAGPVSTAISKAIELEQHWDTIQRANRVPWRIRLRRLLRLAH